MRRFRKSTTGRRSAVQDALSKLAGSGISGESEGLAAFDTNRLRIYDVATTVYGKGRKGSYELVSKDF